MMTRQFVRILFLIACLLICDRRIFAQPVAARNGANADSSFDLNEKDDEQDDFGPPDFPPGGPGMPGGPGGFNQQETALLKDFDLDRDGILNAAERTAARAKLATTKSARRFPGPPGGGPPGFQRQTTPTLGRRLAPANVRNYPGVPLYDPLALRTIFIQFESADWEKELTDFKGTDVEVPAKVTIDGATYNDVGVHFHGMSSYQMVSAGQKRSMVLTFDLVHPNQQVEGYRKLNLLNSHEDASFLHTVLALRIAREYIPAPKANLVRVAINGECWGIYVNQQHFNKDFVRDNFGSTAGARWKIQGNPGPHSTFVYQGDDPAVYKRAYSIKSKDSPDVWKELIHLCRVINQTPADQLEAALAPILDIDAALRFMAWDNVMANGDGFWTRNSDIDLYLDKTGRFHVIPYDANECFSTGGGPGGPPPGGGPPSGMRRMGPPPWMRSHAQTSGTMQRPNNQRGGRPGFGPPGFGPPGGGPGGPGMGGGVSLDPLVAAKDASKPMISKLLAASSLRARYLEYVRDMNEKWLDWNKLGPIAQQYHDLIDADVNADTRKLDSYEEFKNSLLDAPKQTAQAQPAQSPFGPRSSSIKSFVAKRHEYLTKYKPVSKDAITTHSQKETKP